MPMFVKLDIGKKGRITAQVVYGKEANSPTFTETPVIIEGASVVDTLRRLSNYFLQAGKET